MARLRRGRRATPMALGEVIPEPNLDGSVHAYCVDVLAPDQLRRLLDAGYRPLCVVMAPPVDGDVTQWQENLVRVPVKKRVL